MKTKLAIALAIAAVLFLAPPVAVKAPANSAQS